MLEVVELTVEEAIEMLDNGEIVDGKTSLSLTKFKNRLIEDYVLKQDEELVAKNNEIKDLQLKLSILENKPQV